MDSAVREFGYVRRFPRMLFPRFSRSQKRTKQGALMCICGKPGHDFVYVGHGRLRGFCQPDGECYKLFRHYEMLGRLQ